MSPLPPSYDPEAGKDRKAWVFVMTLGFSRHMAARIVFDQKVESWLRLHIECFEELGGVPKTIVPDNLKAAVIRAAFGVDEETTLNRSYRELARHYGFVVDPTPPRSPEKKGKVESSVRYIKGNYFTAHAPTNIREARAALQRWLVDIAGQRRHGTTGKRPAEVFLQSEKPLLPVGRVGGARRVPRRVRPVERAADPDRQLNRRRTRSSRRAAVATCDRVRRRRPHRSRRRARCS